MELPEFSIRWFFTKFNKQPSIIEVVKPYNELIYNSILKKEELWFMKKVDTDGNIIGQEKLIEYDASGILIYINSDEKIFILTTPDRKSVAEYTLQTLKKIK